MEQAQKQKGEAYTSCQRSPHTRDPPRAARRLSARLLGGYAYASSLPYFGWLALLHAASKENAVRSGSRLPADAHLASPTTPSTRRVNAHLHGRRI